MAPPVVNPSEQIRAAGWRQGSVVLGTDLLGQGCQHDLAVVLSQDCDVLQDIEVEPVVELLLGYRVAQANSGQLNGRHPRLLDVPVVARTGQGFARFLAQDRIFLPKEKLAPVRPSVDVSLPERSLKCMRDWVVRRYVRAAFPDAFNERLRPVRDRLDRLSKSPESAVITGVYVILAERDQELAPDQTYHASVWLAVMGETISSDGEYALAVEFEARFRDIFAACEGVRLQALEVRSEDDISLKDLRIAKRFDWDYRSYAGGARPPVGL